MYKIIVDTFFVGQKMIAVPTCDSTNTLLAELALQTTLPEGTVVIAAHQTAGRGQRGNRWETTAGMNLTFSILIKPIFLSVKNQFYLTLVTSLAVTDFLKTQTIDEVKIKWPNDILVEQKKISGILIENSIHGEIIQQSIVGIGLNINQLSFAEPRATSLTLLTKKKYELNNALNGLLEKFEQRYLQLRAKKFEALKNEYLKNLFGLGNPQKFIIQEKKMEGTIIDVNESGELLMKIEENIVAFKLKDIRYDW